MPGYLQVNLRTVYRLIKAGKIPAVRIGRQWRFRKRDIDAWLEQQRSTAQSPQPARSGIARVLVVDDEPSILDLLSRTLHQYQVDTASDAADALRLLRTGTTYDLMIADLNVPGADGLSLIRGARQIDATLPIIIITGFSTEASAIEAVNLGVTGYLTKPFEASQVLAAASRAMGV